MNTLISNEGISINPITHLTVDGGVVQTGVSVGTGAVAGVFGTIKATLENPLLAVTANVMTAGGALFRSVMAAGIDQGLTAGQMYQRTMKHASFGQMQQMAFEQQGEDAGVLGLTVNQLGLILEIGFNAYERNQNSNSSGPDPDNSGGDDTNRRNANPSPGGDGGNSSPTQTNPTNTNPGGRRVTTPPVDNPINGGAPLGGRRPPTPPSTGGGTPVRRGLSRPDMAPAPTRSRIPARAAPARRVSSNARNNVNTAGAQRMSVGNGGYSGSENAFRGRNSLIAQNGLNAKTALGVAPGPNMSGLRKNLGA